MISRGSVPWVVMGQDAVKPTYRQQMRHLSHVIMDRPAYEDQSNSVLTGRVVRLENSEAIELSMKSLPNLVAKLYDARVGGFHYVVSHDEDSWPYGTGSVGVLFSDRIEGHTYTAFDILSYAVRDRGLDQWSLIKTPLHVEFKSGIWHLSNK